MKLYNTLSKGIEEFVPWHEDVVTLYTCGPTVYHYVHIGNLRTYIMEDVLEKALRMLGYNVKRCMNITDVGHMVGDGDDGEDKMAVASKREHKSSLEIAKFYTDAFKKDCDKLNIKWPEIVSPATENIEEYIKIIKTLLEKDIAYIAGGNVYFDTEKFPNYYELSGKNKDDLLLAVRDSISEDNAKRNPFDFGLWFTNSKFASQELKWPSPWGEGYPGWHIECSGINIKYLGEYLDIHCGAEDAVFPHHTNEIAQSEGYLGHKWCKYWVHMGFLNDQEGKMSKSKGDFLTLEVLENKGYNPLAYRFMCLNSHYHSKLVFTYDALDNAQNTYKKLKNRVLSLKDDGDIDSTLYDNYLTKFKGALADNLNTANAITLLYDVLKEDTSDATKKEIINKFDEVLSLDLMKKDLSVDEEYIKEMIAKRNEAKQNKDYVLADSIRDELLKEGISLKDTREGTTYEVL